MLVSGIRGMTGVPWGGDWLAGWWIGELLSWWHRLNLLFRKSASVVKSFISTAF